MNKIKSFTIKFDLNDEDLIDALSHDDNFAIAIEQMKVNFAYELYLMCNERQRKTAFEKDGCVTATVSVNADDVAKDAYYGDDYA
jgi:hypothetical protein